VVGDRLADLGAARAAGAVGVLIPSEATEPAALGAADFVVASLAQLPDLIDTLTGEQQ
jgi:phosphoglycolate phosphatase-like HAD superfamily hydrolase